MGFGWILANLQVYLRDTAQVLVVILTFWFWLTPIFITEQQFLARLRFLLAGYSLAYLVARLSPIVAVRRRLTLGEMGITAAFATSTFLAGCSSGT